MAKIAKFTGLNNVAPDYISARPGDLQRANGVIIDNSGKIIRRNALASVVSGDCRDIFHDGDNQYYVSGTDLIKYDGNSETVLLSTLSAGKMRYWKVNDSIYFSNGAECGVIESGTVRSWGLNEPTAPTVSQTNGQLIPGTYIVALTYVRTNGMESGTSETVSCDVTSGGISITGIVASADADVVGIAVYVSGVSSESLPDGSGLRLAVLLPNANGSHAVTDPSSIGSGRRCKTFGMRRPPAPTHACVYNGRMFYALLNVIWYSPFYQWECIDADRAFLVIPQTVRAIMPTQNGIWVGTTQDFFFMAGKDPVSGGMVMTGRQPLGVSDAAAIVGSVDTMRRLAPGQQVLLVSSQGPVLCDSAGASLFLTDSVWRPDDIDAGQSATLDRTHIDLMFMFTTGSATKMAYAMNVRTGAITSLDLPLSADGLSSSGPATWLATPSGVYLFGTGTSDEGIGYVDAEIWKLGLTFGTSKTKSITELYILMVCEGEYTITTTAGDLEAAAVSADSSLGHDNARYFKAKCARGLRAGVLGIKFVNIDGAMFRITEIEPVIDASPTRRGRQAIG